MALGSGFELETQLMIADAANMGQKDVIQPVLQALDEEQKMLMAFIRRLE